MHPVTSSSDVPPAQLEEVARLSGAARRSSRWYRTYLLVFAAASFVLAVATGLLAGTPGVAVVAGLWAAFVAVSSVWVGRRPTAIRGMKRLHLGVMAGWTAAWLLTVVLGTAVFPEHLRWWVLGGLLTAAAPVVGAVLAHRRTA
ncbi:hypothetical protein GCM10009616_12660 [Microlunatus lacustris]